MGVEAAASPRVSTEWDRHVPPWEAPLPPPRLLLPHPQRLHQEGKVTQCFFFSLQENIKSVLVIFFYFFHLIQKECGYVNLYAYLSLSAYISLPSLSLSNRGPLLQSRHQSSRLRSVPGSTLQRTWTDAAKVGHCLFVNPCNWLSSLPYLILFA